MYTKTSEGRDVRALGAGSTHSDVFHAQGDEKSARCKDVGGRPAPGFLVVFAADAQRSPGHRYPDAKRRER